MHKPSLFRQLYAVHCFGILLVGFVIWAYLENGLLPQLEQDAQARLNALASSVIVRWEETGRGEQILPLRVFVHRLAEKSGTAIAIVSPQGEMAVSSPAFPLRSEPRTRQEMIVARYEDYGAVLEETDMGHRMVLARELVPGETQGFVWIVGSLPEYALPLRRGRKLLWTVTSLLAVLPGIGFWLLTRHQDRRLWELTTAMQAISTESLHQRVDAQSWDASGDLAHSFNVMSEELTQQFADLDARRRLSEENQALLETVLGTMIEGVVAIDPEYRVLFANRAARPLFDSPPQHLLGRRIWEMSRQRQVQEVVQKVLETHLQETTEIEIPRSQKILVLHGTRLPGQPSPGMVLVMHDVTELRRLETMRRDFVANVSHELKTPLASIQAYTETLLNGAIHDDNINLRFLQKIDSEAERLHSLVMDLLRLGRIESQPQTFEMEPVLVAECVSDCLESRRAVAAAQGVTLKTPPSEPDVMVMADQEGLRTILDNLVDNAIKYTPMGGEVSVSWEEGGGQVAIQVKDTGVGIPREHLDRIFERFYRVDKARSREVGGTGLGLSIVKHLAHVFGGRVEVQSQTGKGSCFTVSLNSAE